MIKVDHLGMPARAKLDAVRFLADIFDVSCGTPAGPFAPVRVNPGFTIDFFDSAQVESMHVAFVADDATFDGILQRLRSAGVAYGSQPNAPTNGRIDHPLAERGLYFRTPDGHLLEIMAAPSGAESA